LFFAVRSARPGQGGGNVFAIARIAFDFERWTHSQGACGVAPRRGGSPACRRERVAGKLTTALEA